MKLKISLFLIKTEQVELMSGFPRNCPNIDNFVGICLSQNWSLYWSFSYIFLQI